jgi:hypothetical protein
MNPETYKLTTADRAELCRRVDLLAVLAGDGVEVKKNGAAYLCRLRAETVPSCHLYPPGVGLKGADGWTLKDFGDGWGGDALAYLVDKRGLPFLDAVRELCRLANWTPATMPETMQYGRAGGRVAADLRPPGTQTPKPPQMPADVPRMEPAEQFTAACAFVDALGKLCPDAAALGRAYLSGRGCLPDGWPGGAWVLTGADCQKLAAQLTTGPDADLLTRARILKPAEGDKPLRLAWWGRVCLLACHDAETGLAYFVGRRLDWKETDTAGKYINQPCAGGAVRWPYNLPALYHAAGRLDCWPVEPAKDKAGDVLLVEGALDALGAAVLGWPAVALLNRPQAYDYADRDGAAARMLTPHLSALRDVRRVLVVPDADQGTKGAEGESLAARLVGWLRFSGVKAEIATLADLCAPANCKDLADWAEKIKGKIL